MSLQHKGGVGKSFVANCVAQYYIKHKRPVKIIDADPSNKTLAAYKGLEAEAVDIMKANNTVDPLKFDDIVEDIISSKRDFVIDNGATNFLPFMAYMVGNNIAELLDSQGRDLFLHVPIVGAEALLETLQGFDDIANNIGEPARIVVWLNEALKGLIKVDGKEFEETQVYMRHKSRIAAFVRVPFHDSEEFTKTMDHLLTRKMTFDEAMAGNQFSFVVRQRFQQIQREIFEQFSFVI